MLGISEKAKSHCNDMLKNVANSIEFSIGLCFVICFENSSPFHFPDAWHYLQKKQGKAASCRGSLEMESWQEKSWQ